MDYQYYSTDVSGADAAATAAVFGALMLFYLVVAVVSYIITGIFLGKIFQKAGQPSWIAWVPIYNVWKILELGGQPSWWAILLLIPGVNLVALVFMYIAMYHIGLKFGKPGAFVLLAIFLMPVWLIWLAVDKSTWNGASVATAEPMQAVPAGPAEVSAPVSTPPADDINSPQPPTSPNVQ